MPGFKAQLCLFSVMKHGRSSVTTLYLSFLIFEQRRQKALPHRVDVVSKLDDAHRALSIVSDT